MDMRTPARRFVVVALFGAAASLACEDETILVSEQEENRPPTIVLTGPEFPSQPLEAANFGGPSLFVLVADPNGVDDISAVLLNIDSVRINGVVARPDTVITSSCPEPRYVPGDTIDIQQLIPGRLPGRTELLNANEGSGLYSSAPLFPPNVIAASDSESIDRTFPGCLAGGGWIEFFTLLAPAVPEDELAFTTQEDVTYFGISATVYDEAGDSARAMFPDLRIVYRTDEEKRTAP